MVRLFTALAARLCLVYVPDDCHASHESVIFHPCRDAAEMSGHVNGYVPCSLMMSLLCALIERRPNGKPDRRTIIGRDMRIVDLRSDTKTLPSPEMRVAIAEAELGDADEGEDPTVNRLEALAAERLGKEDAVLVTSGTQGNMVAILSQCARGDSVIVGRNTHINLGEAGGLSALAGVTMHALDNTPDGGLDPDEIRIAINHDSRDWPKTGMVSLENTQNLLGGLVLDKSDIESVADIAHEHDLPFHIDGARLFNAAVNLKMPVSDLVDAADTVTFCLSKGLGAPVGSVLCGSRETIEEARRWVKYLGGSMRQAGIIAAAGVYALNNMVERLAEDHDNAPAPGQGLAAIPGLEIDPERVQTNILFCQVNQAPLCRTRRAHRGRGHKILRHRPRIGLALRDRLRHNRLRHRPRPRRHRLRRPRLPAPFQRRGAPGATPIQQAALRIVVTFLMGPLSSQLKSSLLQEYARANLSYGQPLWLPVPGAQSLPRTAIRGRYP